MSATGARWQLTKSAGACIRRQSLSSPAVTSAVTLDLVQQLGTERIEEMPDHAVLREEVTFALNRPDPEKVLIG